MRTAEIDVPSKHLLLWQPLRFGYPDFCFPVKSPAVVASFLLLNGAAGHERDAWTLR